MKTWIGRIGILLFLALIAMQFVPIERTNPPVESDVPAPPELKEVLRRACYDCHSNETRWPWYSRVAPVSFLIANDVKEGRSEVNFSQWSQYNGARKGKKLKEIAEQVEKGEMPQWYYVLIHTDAKLSAGDKEIIINWAKQK